MLIVYNMQSFLMFFVSLVLVMSTYVFHAIPEYRIRVVNLSIVKNDHAMPQKA